MLDSFSMSRCFPFPVSKLLILNDYLSIMFQVIDDLVCNICFLVLDVLILSPDLVDQLDSSVWMLSLSSRQLSLKLLKLFTFSKRDVDLLSVWHCQRCLASKIDANDVCLVWICGFVCSVMFLFLWNWQIACQCNIISWSYVQQLGICKINVP